jgi:L-lactate dehydrogenase complex protein LldE|tara:strand:+ start:431 stop:1159 length:729 start_codon:yes stop_codon:yes gene_type:complete
MNPMEVDLFIPCFIDQVYPQTGFNMIKVLEKAGVKVHYNTNQTCCGQMAFNSGFWDDAKKLGEKFITDFNSERLIVGPSASCIGYVRNGYDELFFNGAYHNEYKQLQRNMYEITDFLVNVVKVTNFGSVFEHNVTYHDSCAALREYKLNNEPRQLLENVKGLQLVEMKNTHECCGFGGTFSIKFEPISTAMAEQKVRNALDTGAEYIISTDSSCLMQLDGYIKKQNLPIKVAHIVDVLASGL